MLFIFIWLVNKFLYTNYSYNHEKLTSLPLTNITVSAKDLKRDFYTYTQEVTVTFSNIFHKASFPSSLTFASGARLLLTVINVKFLLELQCSIPVERHMFPLVLAYRFTAHKSQCSTYQYMVADFTIPLSSLANTMPSRVTSRYSNCSLL